MADMIDFLKAKARMAGTRRDPARCAELLQHKLTNVRRYECLDDMAGDYIALGGRIVPRPESIPYLGSNDGDDTS